MSSLPLLTPTAMLPATRKPIPPNIFFSVTSSPSSSRSRSARTSSYATAASSLTSASRGDEPRGGGERHAGRALVCFEHRAQPLARRCACGVVELGDHPAGQAHEEGVRLVGI